MIPQSTLGGLARDIYNSTRHPLGNHLPSNNLGEGREKEKGMPQLYQEKSLFHSAGILLGYCGGQKSKNIQRKKSSLPPAYKRIKARVEGLTWASVPLAPQGALISAVQNNLVTNVLGDNCSDSSSSPGKHEAQPQGSHQETYK